MDVEVEARHRQTLLDHLRSARFPKQCRCGWVPSDRCPHRLAALQKLGEAGLLAGDAVR